MDDYPSTYAREYKQIGARVGLGLIGFAGLSSALSTFGLLIYISHYAFFSRDDNSPLVRGLRSFSRSALGAFLFSLLVSDLIQGVAFTINLKWTIESGVRRSPACTAQGAVSQIGDLGGALWSLAIAYYTFSLLFLLKKPAPWLTYTLLGAGWTLIFVFPILGPTVIQNVKARGHFYGISGAWCWIGDHYQVERLIYVYMWIFLSLISSLVLYGLVYLRFSGLLFYENRRLVWKKPNKGLGRGTTTTSSHATGASNSDDQNVWQVPNTTAELNGGIGKHLKKIARRLMLYPLTYAVVTVPVAVCRLGAIAGWDAPFPLYILSGITFSSSGIANVILFVLTRHSFIQRTSTMRPRIHVVTQQLTVLEDAQGAQTIHLHDIPTTGRSDEEDEKGGAENKESMMVRFNHGSSSSSDRGSVDVPRLRLDLDNGRTVFA